MMFCYLRYFSSRYFLFVLSIQLLERRQQQESVPHFCNSLAWTLMLSFRKYAIPTTTILSPSSSSTTSCMVHETTTTATTRSIPFANQRCRRYKNRSYGKLVGKKKWSTRLYASTTQSLLEEEENDAVKNMFHDETTARNDVDCYFPYLLSVREEITKLAYTKEWELCIEHISEALRQLQQCQSQNVSRSTSLSPTRISSVPIRLEAEHLLATALGWKSWATTTSKVAKRYIKPKRPNPIQIRTSIDWLLQSFVKSLSTTRDDDDDNDDDNPTLRIVFSIIQNGILNCPETYLLNPEQSYHQLLQNVKHTFEESINQRTTKTKTSEENDTNDMMLSSVSSFVHNLLQQDPCVLQITHNCAVVVDEFNNNNGGGCTSNCNTCWVTYTRTNSIKII